MPTKLHSEVNGHQVLDRLLRSDVFRHSDSLRRLLRYLCEKSLAGEADDLKEFTIGIEALGKPDDYNPQIDPSVRVQVGRLRTKLDQYYRTEGAADPSRITLPKRHFRIVFEKGPRPPVPDRAPTPNLAGKLRFWRGIAVAGALVAVLFAGLAFRRAVGAKSATASGYTVSLSKDQRAFWGPYLEGSRPTVICIGTPMFVWFEGPTGTFVRDPLVNDWPVQAAEGKFAALQEALGGVPEHPVYEYTGLGEAMSAFVLGKQLASAGFNSTLVRSNHFSWDGAKRTNIIYFGAPKNIPHLRGDQFPATFKIVPDGIENTDPQAGEKSFYGREVLPNGRPRWTHAVIGRYRAKDEFGHVTTFSSWDGPGVWAAVEYINRPASMARLDALLRQNRDEYPPSFEVLIRAEFDQEFPIKISYVTHRIH